jgi:RluA family pseudouridine synthase
MSTARIVVGPDGAGLRADALVCRELPGLSRTRVRQKIQMGEALLNGKRFATSTRLRAGDEIVVKLRSALPAPGSAPAAVFPVLFEDEHLIAVDKPAGVATHPMGKTQSGTVIQFARQRYRAEIAARLGAGDREWYPRSVNRLDVFTSGVVLVALTRQAQRWMQVLLAHGKVRKEYVALVEGTVAADSGSVDLPIGPDPASGVRVKMAALPGGRPSVTRYTVLRRLPAHTLLLVQPETGRQHQIRVHLAAIGHPVVGDLLYRDERLFLRALAPGDVHRRAGSADSPLPARHMLHATLVEFPHPVTGSMVRIESPLPPDFASLIAGLGEPGAQPVTPA